jgi:hypothetical protein
MPLMNGQTGINGRKGNIAFIFVFCLCLNNGRESETAAGYDAKMRTLSH